MGIARGIAKAAKAQSRGLSGKRNSQGDFMPEDVQMKGIQESVEPDIQKYVDDVKSQIDEIDAKILQIEQDPTYYLSTDDLPFGQSSTQLSLEKQIDALTAQKSALVDDLIDKLNEEGIEIPEELADLELDSLRRGATWSSDENQYMY